MGLNFNHSEVRKYMFDGEFGLEKESLRVDAQGYMVHTPHPFPEDSRIDRDFCENQLEMITDVFNSAEECIDQLKEIHAHAVKTLWNLPSGREYIWPFSSPAYIRSEEDVPIAQYEGERREKTVYRNYLADKYGRKKMCFSGIHFNFSFSDQLLQAAFDSSEEKDFRQFKDGIYLELAEKSMKFSWLIVYLTAASSAMDSSYFDDKKLGMDAPLTYASPRCSAIGYWNDFIPMFSFDTTEDYVESIEKYVRDGRLCQASELYYPIRLKPRGTNSLEHLKDNGVNHIEYRMLDLNPFTSCGILKEDLKFLHYFILYLMSRPKESFDFLEQSMAVKNCKRAAEYDEKHILIERKGRNPVCVTEAVLEFLDEMEIFFRKMNSSEALRILAFERNKAEHPEQRYAAKVAGHFLGDYVKKGTEQAEIYAEQIVKQYPAASGRPQAS